MNSVSIEIIALVACVIFAIVMVIRNEIKHSKSEERTATIQCPNCGSPATLYSDFWECGYCGDSGEIKRS